MSVAKIEPFVLSGAPHYLHDPSGTAPLDGRIALSGTEFANAGADHRNGGPTMLSFVPTSDVPTTDHRTAILGSAVIAQLFAGC